MASFQARPDELTVARALRGDRDALGALYRALNPAVVRFLASLGTPEPDDVAAQVWLDLAQRMPAVRADFEELRTVILTIARRRAIDRHRHQVRHPADLVGEVPSGASADLGRTVDDHLEAVALLRRLSPAVAEVVYLRAALDLSAAEVGRITGRSEGAVRVMAMRGLRELRAMASSPGREVGDVTDHGSEAMVET